MELPLRPGTPALVDYCIRQKLVQTVIRLNSCRQYMKTLLHALCVTAILACPAIAQNADSSKPAVSPASEFYPLGIVVDSEGTAFVVDRQLHGVWRYKDGKLDVLFEGSPKYRTPLYSAFSIALDPKGKLLVGDTATREIYRMDAEGKIEPVTGGKVGIPVDLAVKPDGTIYAADLELRKLIRIGPGSSEVEYLADANPRGVFVDAQQKVWVVSQDPEQLQIVSDGGESKAIVDHRIFNFPHQVAVNSKGEAFVTDGYEKAIWKIVEGSEPKIWFQGEPLVNPVGITLVDDLPVVVDPRARKVFKFTADGKCEEWFEIRR